LVLQVPGPKVTQANASNNRRVTAVVVEARDAQACLHHRLAETEGDLNEVLQLFMQPCEYCSASREVRFNRGAAPCIVRG
jgi:hypothetical protein